MSQLKKEASEAGKMLQFGLAIDIGGRLAQGIASAVGSLQQLVQTGIRFNANLQDSQLGVAAILRQFSPTQFTNFRAAMAESGKAIELLKEKAKTSPASFGQLVSAFQGVSGAAMAAGIPIRQQVDLVVQMSQALAGLGIRSDQILQESRALLTGNITEDAMAAKILGITKADIDGAKQKGQLYDFLSQKLAAFGEAGAAGAKNFTTASSNLQDAIEQLSGEASKPIFDILTKSILELQDVIADPGFQQGMISTGQDIAGISKIVAGGTKELIANLPVLLNIGKVLLAAGFALAGQQLVGSINGMLNALWLLPAALGPVGIAITAATAAYLTLNAVMDKSLEKQRAQLDQATKFNAKLAELMDTVRNADTEAGQRQVKLEVETALTEKKVKYFEAKASGTGLEDLARMQEEVAALQTMLDTFELNKGINPKTAQAPKIDVAGFETSLKEKQFAELPPNAQLSQLQSERDATLGPALAALGADEKATVADLIVRYKELAQVKRTISLEAAIPTEEMQSQVNALKVQQAETLALKAEAEKADQRALFLGDRKALQDSKALELGAKLGAIEDALAKAQDRLSDSQERNKTAATEQTAAIGQSGVAVGKLAEALQPAIAAEEKLNIWLEANAKKASPADIPKTPIPEKIATELSSPGFPAQPDAGSLPDPTWDSVWADYFTRIESMGASAATVIQGSLESAINSVSGAISQAIQGTKTWGQAFAQAGNQIISQLIQMGVQFILNNTLQLVGHGIMKTGAALGGAIRTADVTAHGAAEATKAAASLPAALLTSVSSYGVAAAIGLAAVLAAIAAFGGFAEGGYTGSGGKYEPAGMVHKGEYVFTQEQTRRIGVSNLERWANTPTSIQPMSGYADGGLVGGGDATALQPVRGGSAEGSRVNVAAPKVNVAVVNNRDELRRFLESSDGQTMLSEHVNGQLRTRAL